MDTLTNIEGIIGSNFDDVLLRGFVVSAWLKGGDGNDTFHDHNAGNVRWCRYEAGQLLDLHGLSHFSGR
jgi:hypothetical protein